MKLTKSDFIAYLDSPLHLWAKANNQLSTIQLSEYDKLLAKQGYKVEKLAKQFLRQKINNEYPNGSTLDFQHVLKHGKYEARIDALAHDIRHDTYDLYEIKSSTKINKQHKYDATFQHLIGKSTLPIHKTYLVHLNSDYVKNGEIDLKQLFEVEDMTEVILKLEDEVFALRAKALEIIEASKPPLDVHCYKPKTCPCKQLCHTNLNEYPIYDLSWWKRNQYEKLVDKGYTKITDISEEDELNPKQILQIRSAKTKQAIINKEAIKKVLDSLVFPLYFLDYETFNPAIPIHDEYKPYQHITFQYSLHALNNPNDKELKHYEFLTASKEEPSKQLVESLLKNIGTDGSIIVWNKSFECNRNKELASLQDIYASELENINKRVFDLMEVFRRGYYVDYRFHGSASIKKVLPVLVPELTYDGMEIGEGATAMTKWYDLVHGDLSTGKNFSVTKQGIAGALLKYCELDTLAMVEIWRVLKKITN